MLFHVSIEADDPRRVAAVLAEIWQGQAARFPAVMPGSWMALAGDARGTIVEIYPRGTELHPGDQDAVGISAPPRRNTATHLAMATDLSVERLYAIAAREDWPVRYCRRGGRFGVVELWIEGCQMVEILTPEMQAEYVHCIADANWQGSAANDSLAA